MGATTIASLQGCANTVESEPAAEEDVILNREFIATIAYGETKEIVYRNSGWGGKYRAFEFDGATGDTIDVWVRSAQGNAAVFLMEESGMRNGMNADANASTLDAHLERTLRKTGKHSIVIYDEAYETAAFSVTLQKLATPSL